MLRISRLLLFGLATSLPVFAAAQEFGTIHMETKLGSFKIKKNNLESPAEGRLEISFTGTLLISGYQGKPIMPTIKGNIRQEFPDPKVLPKYNEKNFEKIVLHGKGSLVIDGKYMAVQWFGRDMKATWTGRGFLHMFGEYDENGNTGTYYFNDPKKVAKWQTNDNFHIPTIIYGGQAAPGDVKVVPKKKTTGGGNKGKG